MKFDRVIHALGQRLLSEREFDLILAPALADYAFDRHDASIGEWTSRAAVLIAFAGALDIQVRSNAALFISMALVPACYYVVLLSLWSTFFRMTGVLTMFAWMIVVMSLSSVMLCFLPERRSVRPVE